MDPTQTPAPAGQLSPDGRWQWDGTRWVPTGVAPATGGARRSRAWLWWLGGGCAVLLVIAVVGGAVGFVSLVNSFKSGSFSCLPSDFPMYPGASVVVENNYVGTGVPAGDTHECRMQLASNDDVSTVTDWYSSQLNSGDWQATTDQGSGTIHFTRQSRALTEGSVQLLGAGQHTEIRIVVDS